MPRLLDLFCGRWGWSKAFAARGWKVIGVDMAFSEPPSEECRWEKLDILDLDVNWVRSWDFDFIVASSPCEEFSVHGMKHFHPNPKYPEMGIKLFNHTRSLCEASGVPYVMENVKQAEQFVGKAQSHAGSFYLWGNAVPPLVHKGLIKGFGNMSTAHYHANLKRMSPHIRAKNTATIPPELAGCVADYAGRLLEMSDAQVLRLAKRVLADKE